MSISDQKLAEIRAGLEESTPGPWGVAGKNVFFQRPEAVVARCRFMEAYVPLYEMRAEANARHIARLDPQTVASLLDRLDKAEAALRPFALWGARLSRDMPGREAGCASFYDSNMPLLFRDFHAAADALPPPPGDKP